MEISSDWRFRECLAYLAKKFHKQIRHSGERQFITLAPKTDPDQIHDAIVHQVVTTMKSNYLESKIKIKHEILIRILINYDQKTDIIIATNLVKLAPTVLLDAIYDFGIRKLKQRWDEVAQLVNENQLRLTQPELFSELLRFLILNLDHKVSEAHIVWLDNQVRLCNRKLEPFSHTDPNIMYALIDVAPRQVFIHVNEHFPEGMVKEISSIFPNCVCIEYSLC